MNLLNLLTTSWEPFCRSMIIHTGAVCNVDITSLGDKRGIKSMEIAKCKQ